MLDVDYFLAVDVHDVDVLLKSSNMRHPNAGLGGFTAVPFGRGSFIRSYYGILVSERLARRQQSSGKYREHAMPVSSNIFPKWHNKEPEKPTNGTRSEQHVLVLPAPTYPIPYVNDGVFKSGNGASESAGLLKYRQSNVDFYQTRFNYSFIKFKRHSLLAMCANKNSGFNKKQYVDYGSAIGVART